MNIVPLNTGLCFVRGCSLDELPHRNQAPFSCDSPTSVITSQLDRFQIAEPQHFPNSGFGQPRNFPTYTYNYERDTSYSQFRQDGKINYPSQVCDYEWQAHAAPVQDNDSYMSQPYGNGPYYRNQVLTAEQMAQYVSPVSSETEAYDYFSGTDDSVSSESPHPYESTHFEYFPELHDATPWATPNPDQFYPAPQKPEIVSQPIQQHSILSQRASPPRPRTGKERRTHKSLPSNFGSELSQPRITRGRTRRPSMFSIRQRMMEVVRSQGESMAHTGSNFQFLWAPVVHHQPPTH